MGKKKPVKSKPLNESRTFNKLFPLRKNFLFFTLVFILLFTIYSFIFNYLRVWSGLYNLYTLFSEFTIASFLIISAWLVTVSIAFQVILLKECDKTTFQVFGIYSTITLLCFQNTNEIFSYLLNGTWKWYLFLSADLVWQAASFYVIFIALKKSNHSWFKKKN